MDRSKPSPVWIVLSLALISIGLVVSYHLLTIHFVLIEDSSYRGDVCFTVFGKSCSETLQGNFSSFLRIPTAGWGLVYFASLATLLLLGWTMGEGFAFEASLAAFVLSVAGGLGSVALTAVMLTGLASLCPLCLVIHSVNLLLVYPLRRVAGRSGREAFSGVLGAFRYIFGAKVEDEDRARWKVLGLMTSGLVAVMLYQWVYVRSELVKANVLIREASAAERPKLDVLEDFEKAEIFELAYRPDDPVRGLADAAVTLTMFSDFQCPACAKFEKTVTSLLESYPGSLRVVFKHYPLDGKCNSAVEGEFHAQACPAAEASEAARIQGKFWEFHDLLFAREDGADMIQAIDEIAAEIGLDLERFSADRASLEVGTRIREDIAQGIEVGVHGTPWIYINGRVAQSIGLGNLRKLIDREIEHAGRSHDPGDHDRPAGEPVSQLEPS